MLAQLTYNISELSFHGLFSWGVFFLFMGGSTNDLLLERLEKLFEQGHVNELQYRLIEGKRVEQRRGAGPFLSGQKICIQPGPCIMKAVVFTVGSLTDDQCATDCIIRNGHSCLIVSRCSLHGTVTIVGYPLTESVSSGLLTIKHLRLILCRTPPLHYPTCFNKLWEVCM